MSTEVEEVVVAGGGLAGAAVAAMLARAGRSVTVLERDAFPRDKLCGEFLSPESQQALQTIGCLGQILALRPKEIRAARFYASSGPNLSLSLPGVGLGVRRIALDETLFRHAESAGARCLQRAEVRVIEPLEDQGALVRYRFEGQERSVQASVVIGAYGRRSALDKQLNRPFAQARHPYLALKRHHRAQDGGALDRALQDHVEIHAFDGGYCGMSHVETGEINVCMLLQQRFVERAQGAKWRQVQRALCALSPTLADRFSALEPTGEALAVSQIPFSWKERAHKRVLFVGDAAGMIAPLAGDGQAMAFSAAVLLARLFQSVPRFPSSAWVSALKLKWRARWQLRFATRMRLALALQNALLSRRGADLLVRGVGAVPGAPSMLARLTRGAD